MNLFNFGLTMEEVDCLYVGDIDLLYDPGSECGEWTSWVVNNSFTDWCDNFIYFNFKDDFIHVCHGYRQSPWDNFDEGCVLDA